MPCDRRRGRTEQELLHRPQTHSIWPERGPARARGVKNNQQGEEPAHARTHTHTQAGHRVDGQTCSIDLFLCCDCDRKHFKGKHYLTAKPILEEKKKHILRAENSNPLVNPLNRQCRNVDFSQPRPHTHPSNPHFQSSAQPLSSHPTDI